jgi:glutathione synthase/RimK-type ligase-like ATP-grasp enzyme
MKIGIHQPDGGFGKYWIKYCQENNIPFKLVNCYDTNIINELNDCDALMWHHNHANPKDLLFAKELLFSLETSGKLVFPDTKTTWHFNDKLGQKYLLEAANLPLVPSYVFFSKKEALDWIEGAIWPLVFKLRCGAGGRNVRLIRNKKEAKKIINQAFGKGIRPYNAIDGIRESIRKYKMGKASFISVIKSIVHILYPVQLEKSQGREKGYVYFQKFIPDCSYDIRVQLVDERIWAMIRPTRKNDFRASGSGILLTGTEKIPTEALKLSLEIVRKLKLQSVVIDFLPTSGGLLITEISYAFGNVGPEDTEVGYWDNNLDWHPGNMNPFGWMVENMINRYNLEKKA